MRYLTLLAVCAGLPFLAGSACSSTRSVADRPELARVPPSLAAPCTDVVDVPGRDLTSSEVARLWGADRAALGDCRRRHAALAESLRSIAEQGRGN